MSLILQGAAFKSGCGASVAPPPPPPPPVSGLLVSTGVWGAGFTLTMDYHPTIPGRAIVGGDVSGLFTTVDGGMTWNQGNTELVSDNDRRVPAAKWSRNPATPDLFWVISSGREIPGAAATIWKARLPASRASTARIRGWPWRASSCRIARTIRNIRNLMPPCTPARST